jgi:hypothetical protein
MSWICNTVYTCVLCAGSPEEEEAGGAGLVSSFFASLKSAIYGEQRKQDRSSR